MPAPAMLRRGYDDSPPETAVPPFGPAADAARGCAAADETFDGTWPFRPHFYEGNGFRQHYVDEGDPKAPPVVLLHGEPTWGYLYRNFIPALSASHRVIVPDHMGFGKSETPLDKDYCVAQHARNLIGLVEGLGLKDVTFFAQDWGGPIVTYFALRRPELVRGIYFANTAVGNAIAPAVALADKRAPGTWAQEHRLSSSRWFTWVLQGLPNWGPEGPKGVWGATVDPRQRGPPQGRTEQLLLNMGSTAAYVIKHLLGFQRSQNITDAWVRAYSTPFPTEASAIGALNFPLEAVNQLAIPPAQREWMQASVTKDSVAAFRRIPVEYACGMRDRAIPPELSMNIMRFVWPKIPVVRLEDAGHFCQEDVPETLVALLLAFMQRSRGPIALDQIRGVDRPALSRL